MRLNVPRRDGVQTDARASAPLCSHDARPIRPHPASTYPSAAFSLRQPHHDQSVPALRSPTLNQPASPSPAVHSKLGARRRRHARPSVEPSSPQLSYARARCAPPRRRTQRSRQPRPAMRSFMSSPRCTRPDGVPRLSTCLRSFPVAVAESHHDQGPTDCAWRPVMRPCKPSRSMQLIETACTPMSHPHPRRAASRQHPPLDHVAEKCPKVKWDMF